ncbi:hypothetical protein T484DRAFT_1804189 [Baffinella frigidus]|nr:hypothetical protein T484DRAFT_1804189 [Cryptophyta sp. CCMP2293]
MEEGTGAKGAGAAEEDHFEFHHVQCFANSLLPLQYYKDLEARLNNLANTGHFDPFSGGMRFLEPDAHLGRVQEGRSVWEASNSGAQHETSEYLSHGQDLAEQLVVGLGWRVTAENISGGTRTLLVTSSDPCGVKVCITAPHPSPDRSCNSEGTSPASTPTASDSPTNEEDNAYDHFSLKLVERFKASHSQRQCVGVLGFEVALGALDAILERYRTHHPALLLRNEPSTYSDSRTIGGRGGKARTVELGRMRVLEVFAYYIDDAAAAPDHGTVLRFVERTGTFVERTGKFARAPGFANPEGVLPGLHDVDAHFDGSQPPPPTS